jgi:ribosomal protein S18 acetylase RimI-like enzyme
MIGLRVLSAEDWRLWRELRLEALREAPYAFSSKLADWQGEGDLEERWRRRLVEVPFNVIAELDGRPAGMVSATHPNADGTTTLISMWVAPFARGYGVGDALIGAVTGWAHEQRIPKVELCVMEANVHAAALYQRHAFVDAGEYADSDACAPRQRRMLCTLRDGRPS